MPSNRTTGAVWGACLCIAALYAVVSLTVKDRQTLATFGNLVQCFVPLIANTGLLLNAGTPYWRRNIFWMLLALSCTLWMIGQFQWTYYEVYAHTSMPSLFAGDIIFFLKGVPLIAALALQPHRRHSDLQPRFGYINFVLLLMWWVFLYSYMVFPWIYASPSEGQYNFNYDFIANLQNMLIVVSLGLLWLNAKGAWRTVYANIFGSATLYTLSSLAINVAISAKKYATGGLYDVPLIFSFLWFGISGVVAYQNRDKLDAQAEGEEEKRSSGVQDAWAARLAMAAVISLPVFAIYTLRFGRDIPEVRDFRLMTTLIAAIPLALLVFLRAHLADAERARLLASSEESVENLKRLQAQMVHTEKLVSIGQLAAGAAHEINNPLTAILGYSDLLAEDASIPEKARVTADKIREQARRTKTLVTNLLSFARQVPSERTLLDINTVVSNAVQLRALDLRSSKSRIELQLESVLPGVRGDGNQLLQVFFNIVSNAVDAMEHTANGVLTIKTIRERANVVILFADNGPGLKDPHRVFDPFYTTKPVGKGTGLGLSICFGIVQEHGGRILCYNGQQGGAVFRVELPALLAAFPPKEPQVVGVPAVTQKSSV